MGNLKGFVSLLLAAIIYGTFGIWIRLLNAEMSVFQQTSVRYFFAGIFTLVALIALKRNWSIKGAKPYLLGLYALTFAADLFLFVLAIINTKISTSIFAYYGSAILFSLLIGNLIFKEKSSKLKLASIVIAGMGLVMLSYPFSNLLNLGLIVAIGGGFFDAVANACRKELVKKTDKFVLILIQIASSFVIMFFMVLVSRQAVLPRISGWGWAISALFAALLLVVNYLVLSGFQNYELNLGTIILSSEIVFATVFAALVFGEVPSLTEALGGVLVIISIVLVNLSSGSKKGKNRQ